MHFLVLLLITATPVDAEVYQYATESTVAHSEQGDVCLLLRFPGISLTPPVPDAQADSLWMEFDAQTFDGPILTYLEPLRTSWQQESPAWSDVGVYANPWVDPFGIPVELTTQVGCQVNVTRLYCAMEDSMVQMNGIVLRLPNELDSSTLLPELQNVSLNISWSDE